MLLDIIQARGVCSQVLGKHQNLLTVPDDLDEFAAIQTFAFREANDRVDGNGIGHVPLIFLN